MGYRQTSQKQPSRKRLGCLEWTLIAVLVLGVLVVGVLFAAGALLFYEKEVHVSATTVAIAQPTATPIPLPLDEDTNGTPVPLDDTSGPTLTLNPPGGAPGSSVTVQGAGWPQGANVTAYLVPAEPPQFVIGKATVDGNGAFSFTVLVPSDSRWLNESPVPVIVSVDGQTTKVQTLLNITSPAGQGTTTPDEVIVVPVDWKPTPSIPVPAPSAANLTAKVSLNIRSGPGVDYSVVGVLQPEQQAEIIGRSTDSSWWQIEYPASPQGSGWVSAQYVNAQNFDNIPVVTVAPPPPTATPAPAPTGIAITDWRGEYYNNRDLSGSPVLVRNDPYLSFDWGLGSPDPSIPVDNFSVRWTRTMNFSAATYRFYARVDDGVRLWVDNSLLIDQWNQGSVRTFTADINLTDGPHTVRMDYFEATQYAVAILTWEQVQYYPDWKAEYYNNPDLQGSPILTRSEGSLNYNWNGASPATGVPGQNFSARWTRQQYFDGGDYTFRAQSDDGIRVWINNDLIIDHWQDGASPTLEAKRNLAAGTYQLRVDYYQRSGGSFIGFSWQKDGKAENPPVAVIRGPSESVVKQPASYDGRRSQSSNRIVRYEWDFGDGGRASGNSVSHTFTKTGTYTIKLTVTDSQGLRDSTKITTRIKDQPNPDTPPVPVINGPFYAKVGEPTTFDAKRSTSVNKIVSRDWYFGDGTDASGNEVTHIYNDAGTFQVFLTLVDTKGLRGSTDQYIQIRKNIDPDEPPKPVITCPDQEQVGEPVTFDASKSTAKNKIVSFAWAFGDGATANALMVDHIYESPGVYNVELELTDEKGLTGKTNKLIEIYPIPQPEDPPVAHITAPDEATVGELVAFDGSGSYSDVPITAYEWDFGDGSTGSGEISDHTYSAIGTYTVRLKVTNARGDSGDTAKDITIDEITPGPLPPQAVITGPSEGQVSQSLTFDASASRASVPVTDLKWDFGDGNTAEGLTVAHSYDSAGTYTVILTLVDESGQSDSAVKQVQVADQPSPDSPPVPIISARSAALIGEDVVFDGSHSYASAPLTAADWDFGDGTTASGLTASHDYSVAGTYNVTLTLTDQNGRQGTAQSPIIVTDSVVTPTPEPTPIRPGGPPQAVMDAPLEAKVGESVIFDGSLSHGSSPLVNYQWATGDGTTGAGIAVQYSYSNPGVYYVTLTVTDDDGQSDTATQQITITSQEQPVEPTQEPGPLPTVEPQPQPTEEPGPQPQPTGEPGPQPEPTQEPGPQPEPTQEPQPQPEPTQEPQPEPMLPPVAVISGPQQVQAESQVDFDGSGSSGSTSIADYQWAFGDGGTASGPQVSHSWGGEGSYEVTLTVVDQNGMSNTTSITVFVAPSQAQIEAQQQAEEAARQAAEATRQAEEAQAAEATRQAEEAERQAEEQRRQQEEAERQAEEQRRQQEEAERQAEEQQRQQEEAERQAEEQRRQQEEAERQAAQEATRQAEEAQQQIDQSQDSDD